MKNAHKHKHPVIQVVSLFIDNIDTNPRIQNRIHTFGFWYWTINFPLITYLFFCQPHIWDKYGLFITLFYSIYANWTSDYTGMSASQGLNHVAVEVADNTDTLEDLVDAVQPQPEPLHMPGTIFQPEFAPVVETDTGTDNTLEKTLNIVE